MPRWRSLAAELEQQELLDCLQRVQNDLLQIPDFRPSTISKVVEKKFNLVKGDQDTFPKIRREVDSGSLGLLESRSL